MERTMTEQKPPGGLPDGELLPVKVLALPHNDGGIGKSQSFIRAMRRAGAPFWGWDSTRNDLLRWLLDNPDFTASQYLRGGQDDAE